MAQGEQQPEEAATRPIAAAASAVGSFVQTQMYGRGYRQRTKPAGKEQEGKEQEDKQKAAEQEPPETTARPASPEEPLRPVPARGASQRPVHDSPAAGADRRPVAQLTRPADDPAMLDELLSGTPAGDGGLDQDPAARVGEPEVSADMLRACSEQDAAAAQARLVQGQQLELPPVAPPAPGMAPGL